MRTYKEQGYELQVGDRIEADLRAYGVRIDVVTRVTKTQAICEKTRPEGKSYSIRYPRIQGFYFSPLPRRSEPNTYRVIDKE